MLAITYIGFPDHIKELIIHVSMNVFNSAFMYYGLMVMGMVSRKEAKLEEMYCIFTS